MKEQGTLESRQSHVNKHGVRSKGTFITISSSTNGRELLRQKTFDGIRKVNGSQPPRSHAVYSHMDKPRP